MILDLDSKKSNIDYPCECQYKIIGTDVGEMIRAIEYAVAGMDFKITSSNVNSKGKYISLKLEVYVTSKNIRGIIFAKLKANKCVRMVL